ncbi:MAG: hypothetical protein U0V70_01875 [Terriglobia bacterium]
MPGRRRLSTRYSEEEILHEAHELDHFSHGSSYAEALNCRRPAGPQALDGYLEHLYKAKQAVQIPVSGLFEWGVDGRVVKVRGQTKSMRSN